MCTCGSRDNFAVELVLPSHLFLASEDGIQVPRLAQPVPNPPSHLTHGSDIFLDEHIFIYMLTICIFCGVISIQIFVVKSA